MRIQYLSDVHVEFHADAGLSFVYLLEPAGVDVLVIAGDFAVGTGIGPALDLICEHYPRAQSFMCTASTSFTARRAPRWSPRLARRALATRTCTGSTAILRR